MTAVCISVLLWPLFQHTSPENLNLIEMLEILLRVMIAYHHHHVLLFSVSHRLILESVWLLFCAICAFWILDPCLFLCAQYETTFWYLVHFHSPFPRICT